jgi:hydrogenase maturation protease
VLPNATFVVGVQTRDTERVGQGLSVTTADAVPAAVAEVRRILTEFVPATG